MRTESERVASIQHDKPQLPRVLPHDLRDCRGEDGIDLTTADECERRVPAHRCIGMAAEDPRVLLCKVRLQAIGV
tara:strand:+ start:210 stop:434 length:225 start_codon:yes stop_codon:yes gene_type:complete